MSCNSSIYYFKYKQYHEIGVHRASITHNAMKRQYVEEMSQYTENHVIALSIALSIHNSMLHKYTYKLMDENFQ